MENNQVIVVGAGIAGLVAAYQLQKNGVTVTVLEASSKAGGRMVTDIADGYIVDGGAQFLSSGYPILSNLIAELKLAANYVETSPYIGIVRHGKIYKFRYDKPLSLLSGGLLRFNEWLALGFGNSRLLKEVKELPVNDYSAWEKFDDETADVWSNGHYGKHITEYIIEPMLEAFYFQSPEETSKALPIALSVLNQHEARAMTLTGGIGTLPEVLQTKLNVLVNTPVRNICIENEGVTIQTDQQVFTADRVILATPAPISKKLYATSSELEINLLNAEYSTTLNVAVMLKKKLDDEWKIGNLYGIWIPRKERRIIAAITIESAKCADRAPTGELINVMLSGKAGRTMIDLEEKQILSSVFSELEEYLPGVTRSVSFSKIYR